jgi:integrase
VSLRKRGGSWQVRVAPFPAKSFPTYEAANAYDLELRLRRAQGDRYVEKGRTLGKEIDAWLIRNQAMASPRTATTRYNDRSSKIWAPFRAVELSALRRAPIEDFVAQRAAAHPRSAKNELEFLKKVLKDAQGRGHRIDERVLGIPPIKHAARRGRALTVEQLYELASWVPEHSKRLVLLAGMVGSRQRVWFEMTDDLLDLRAGTLLIPDWLAKNGREHCVYFTELEVGLFREQLMVRAPGTALVFPTPTGRRWTESGFRERVWSKAVKAAVTNAQLAPGQRSVYAGFNFHLLRHTACSLMALAGMDPAVASERASHTDGGALFLKRYRHLYESEKRVQAGKLEALIRSELDSSGTEDGDDPDSPLNQAQGGDGRGWDRTSDLPRVKTERLGTVGD